MFQYLICGLSVESEIIVSGAREVVERSPEPEVTIRRGAVPMVPDGATGPNWQVDGSRFLFRVPGVVRYQISDGREIVMETEAPGTEADALPFLLGTAIGAILHQRGRLVLHAATVSLDGKGVALCGRSGIGKSTLAAALCRAGCEFISDDMTAVRFDSRQRPFVSPDGRQHRLWADSVKHLSLENRQGMPVRASFRKYHVDPSGIAVPDQVPLTMVMMVSLASPSSPQGVASLSLADAAAQLRTDIYRSRLAARMGCDARLFGQIATLLGQVRAFRLYRGTGFGGLDDTVQAILGHLREAA